MKREESRGSAEFVLRRLDEQHSKYKFLECNLLQKKKRLKKQIPDIKISLDILKLMKSKKNSTSPVETQFLLSDQVYVKAKIPPTETVCLWLGVSNKLFSYRSGQHF
ncbi:prefoldin subunit 3-like [Centruroides sculpturatus]|uniref:prefoldin subunit 3-like n=1 Tax=Centruroides sculpturatus TaxID=218467 RepID=UPI000C6CCDAF|nr:prefoldin subunit 3-like [Centruroides sculpturatus]